MTKTAKVVLKIILNFFKENMTIMPKPFSLGHQFHMPNTNDLLAAFNLFIATEPPLDVLR